MSNKLFEGIRAIDFGNQVSGPLSTAMLADFGAEVIKVEKPGFGDESRNAGPYVDGEGMNFIWLNRGKKSLALDVKSPGGKEVFLDLLRNADVLVESMRPGVMARLGLSWEILHPMFPRLIMCSASGFGQTGPYKDLPGYDMIAQAVSGLMYINGYPDKNPLRIGPSVCDYDCAHNCFGAISAALYYREKTGRGQHIDLSIAECGVAINDHIPGGFVNPEMTRSGNHNAILGPYGIFSGKCGSIALAAINPKFWGALCNLIGRMDMLENPDLSDPGVRARDPALSIVVEAIEKWICTFDDIAEVERLIQDAGIPCARIKTLKDLENDPHFLERGDIVDIPTPKLSVPSIRAHGEHIHFSETPAVIGPAPLLDEHRNYVLGELLGYSKEKLQELTAQGAFGNECAAEKGR